MPMQASWTGKELGSGTDLTLSIFGPASVSMPCLLKTDSFTRLKSKVIDGSLSFFLFFSFFFFFCFLCKGFDGDQIRVLFVEYGNEQMCGFDELRPMVDYQIGDEVEAKFAVIFLCVKKKKKKKQKEK